MRCGRLWARRRTKYGSGLLCVAAPAKWWRGGTAPVIRSVAKYCGTKFLLITKRGCATPTFMPPTRALFPNTNPALKRKMCFEGRVLGAQRGLGGQVEQAAQLGISVFGQTRVAKLMSTLTHSHVQTTKASLRLKERCAKHAATVAAVTGPMPGTFCNSCAQAKAGESWERVRALIWPSNCFCWVNKDAMAGWRAALA